jgi:hypothetical protein
MAEHLSLMIVLAMTWIFGCLKTYAKYQRDWCGIRLIPRVSLQVAPALVLILLLYIEFVHVLRWQIFRDYFVLISFVAAVGAEYAVGKVLHGTPQTKGVAVTVSTRIAKKKIEIANKLLESPSCKDTLTKAIRTSEELGARQQRALLNSLSTHPDMEQILRVIKAVGVAHIKVMV